MQKRVDASVLNGSHENINQEKRSGSKVNITTIQARGTTNINEEEVSKVDCNEEEVFIFVKI